MLRIACILVAALIQMVCGATTAFYYQSGPAGSFVAQGSLGTTIVDGQGGWTFSAPQKPYGEVLTLSMTGPSNQDWDICVQAPVGAVLATGLYQATRYPFQDASITGFSWYGTGRGCNTSTSWVDIKELKYDPTHTYFTAVAIDFYQVEETWNKVDVNVDLNKCAYGSFRYASDDDIDVSSQMLRQAVIPEPSSFALVGIGLGSLLTMRRRTKS